MTTFFVVFFAGIGLMICIFLLVVFLLIYLGDRE